MAGKLRALERGIFLLQIIEQCERGWRWFWRAFGARRARFGGGAGARWQAEIGGERNAECVAEWAQHAAELRGLGDQGGHIGGFDQMAELGGGAGNLMTGEQPDEPKARARQGDGCGRHTWFARGGAGADAGGAGGWGVGGEGAKAVEPITDPGPNEANEHRVDAAQNALVGDDFAQHGEDHRDAIGKIGRAGDVIRSGHIVNFARQGVAAQGDFDGG